MTLLPYINILPSGKFKCFRKLNGYFITFDQIKIAIWSGKDNNFVSTLVFLPTVNKLIVIVVFFHIAYKHRQKQKADDTYNFMFDFLFNEKYIVC